MLCFFASRCMSITEGPVSAGSANSHHCRSRVQNAKGCTGGSQPSVLYSEKSWEHEPKSDPTSAARHRIPAHLTAGDAGKKAHHRPGLLQAQHIDLCFCSQLNDIRDAIVKRLRCADNQVSIAWPIAPRKHHPSEEATCRKYFATGRLAPVHQGKGSRQHACSCLAYVAVVGSTMAFWTSAVRTMRGGRSCSFAAEKP